MLSEKTTQQAAECVNYGPIKNDVEANSEGYHSKKAVECTNSLEPLLSGNQRNVQPIKRTVGYCSDRGQMKLAVLGITLIAMAFAIFVLNPLEYILTQMLTVSEGSYGYELWRKPPVAAIIKIYVFNVTNPEEFLRGEQKLKVEEVGPFVYREQLENTNVTFNRNETVTYKPKRTATFVPDLSIADPSTVIVTLPNVVLVGIASALDSYPALIFGFRFLRYYLKMEAFIKVTAMELFWGYEDSIVEVANTLLPNTIPIAKIGIFEVLNSQEPTFTMNIGPNTRSQMDPDGANGVFTLDNMNGKTNLDYWNYDETKTKVVNGTFSEIYRCNSIKGTYDGVLLPRNLLQNQTLWMYRLASCRPLPLEFEKEAKVYGVNAYYYKIKDNAIMPPDVNPENKCYCDNKRKQCLRYGLIDITPCYYNIPIAVSYPHFYKADKSLVEAIDGMSPDEEKHNSFMAIQPDLGVPIDGHSRLQTNLIAKTKRIATVAPFDNMIIPIVWLDTCMDEVPLHLLFALHSAVNIGPFLQPFIGIMFGIFGSVSVVKAIKTNVL